MSEDTPSPAPARAPGRPAQPSTESAGLSRSRTQGLCPRSRQPQSGVRSGLRGRQRTGGVLTATVWLVARERQRETESNAHFCRLHILRTWTSCPTSTVQTDSVAAGSREPARRPRETHTPRETLGGRAGADGQVSASGVSPDPWENAPRGEGRKKVPSRPPPAPAQDNWADFSHLEGL